MINETVHDPVKQILSEAILAAASALPFEASVARESFRPLDRIHSAQELLWTLDYVADTYRDRVPPRVLWGEKYALRIESIPAGHPVFLLGTLYVLLSAYAQIHVSYSEENEELCDRIIHALLEQDVIQEFTFWDRFSKMDTALHLRRKKISQIVVLGDVPNMHHNYGLIRMMGGCVWHFPSAHLLLADFLDTPVLTQKNRRFSNQCYYCCIDYIAHRAPTNQADRLGLGIDFMDLFWGAEAEITEWTEMAGFTDRIPAIIFTDRPRDSVWLPEGIENCCDVVFFDDYDCDYPLYDFLQLIPPEKRNG